MLRCLLMLMASHYSAIDPPLQWSPDASFWHDVPATVLASDNFGKAQPAHRTEVRSRWTKNYLYFQFTCRYEELYLHPKPVRNSETNQLWDWDVAEVFVGSNWKDIRHYREFELSPQGEWLDLDIDLGRPMPADWRWNSGFAVTTKIDAAQRTWYGAMRIPYSSIDTREASEGNVLRMNLYREQGPALATR